MENLKKTKFDISSVVKHKNDLGYADQLFFKLYRDIEDFFDKLDIGQKKFEQSANDLRQIFLATLYDNVDYINKYVETGVLNQVEYGNSKNFNFIQDSLVFGAVNRLIWEYFGNEKKCSICYYLNFNFISNKSMLIKNSIFKKFYSISNTKFVLDIFIDEYYESNYVNMDKSLLIVAFDLCGVSVELALVEMLLNLYI